LQEVEFGIVYNPILDQLWTARKGHGAYYNGSQVQFICGIPGYLSGVNFFLKTIEKNTNLLKIKLNLALLTKLSYKFLKYICVLSFRYESLAAQIYQNHY
jgi:fructose-1,6-bisphosphatase/inositol monophosphatase family enzyme